MKILITTLTAFGLLVATLSAQPPKKPLAKKLLPIIDMHLHAYRANAQGPPPIAICAPFPYWPDRDLRAPSLDYVMTFLKKPVCKKPLWSPMTDQELMTQSLDILERRNIVAVASGELDVVEKWKQSKPDRIIPALEFNVKDGVPVEKLRQWVKDGKIAVFGEMGDQYGGVTPDDPAYEPYLALAEELDIPIGIHIGPGPPGVAYFGPETKNYRARMHSPLSLEEPLMRHPKLRVYVMHAGWPMIDDMVAMLYAHPQLYVDVGIIVYAFPRAEFYRYLQRLIEAGFGRRVMFGSDQMIWPQAIEKAIESIEAAPFLTAEQKRDIFYNNAARFLRLNKDGKTN